MKTLFARVRAVSLGAILGVAVSLAATPQPAQAAGYCTFCEFDCPGAVQNYCTSKGCIGFYGGCYDGCSFGRITVDCNMF